MKKIYETPRVQWIFCPAEAVLLGSDVDIDMSEENA